MITVIAKYKESLDWFPKLLHGISDKILVYNKDMNGLLRLPNVGREASTYLFYILTYWGELPEYTLFLQGDPRDHFNLLDIEINPDTQFFGKILECDNNGNPHHKGLQVETFAKDYGLYKDKYTFNAGANMVIHRDRIKRYDYNFYYKMWVHSLTYTQHPWIMERLWMTMWD